MGDSLPRGGAPRKGKIVNLRIQFLDDSVHAFQVPVKALGMALWEAVVRHLQLVESDYFDLQYGDKNGLKCWLDNEKPILKQLPSPDSPLEFCVKFYTPDPGLLDEYTRYLFSLQIKKDLATGSMQCSENTAALVASYIAQAEIGDFIVEEYLDHTYLKSLNAFVPHQTEELLKKVMEYHRQHIGESPAEAESSLLDTARKVDTYGVKLCPAKDHENVSLHLSIAHVGILVFQLHTKINTFSWAKVRKLSFKRKKFLIKLHPESYPVKDKGTSVSSQPFKDKGYYKDTVEFFFESRDECKIFWKKCIEHHAFFRCHTVKKVPRNKTRLVSRGSSFRYSGRTQKQLMTFVRETCVKSPSFERSVSGRISCSRSASVTPKITAKAGLHNSTTDTHNSTASSGSHILSPGPDDPTTPSRTETAEVHSVDSSLSGSRSLPSPKFDRSREGTPGAEVDLPDDDAVASPDGRVDRIDERDAPPPYPGVAPVPHPHALRHSDRKFSAPVFGSRDTAPPMPNENRLSRCDEVENIPEVVQEEPKTDDVPHPPQFQRSATSPYIEQDHLESPPPPPPPLDPEELALSPPSLRSTPNRQQDPDSSQSIDGHGPRSNVSVLSSSRTEDSEDDPKRKIKRHPADRAYYIAKELLMTERTYRKDLEVITVWFHNAVSMEGAVPEPTENLFSTLEPIYQFHSKFLMDIDQRISMWEGKSNAHLNGDYQRIGDVLMNNLPKALMVFYKNYLDKQESILTELEHAVKKQKSFEKMYKEFESQKVCYLPLNTFILKPAQRILHYKLLLERLTKHYSKDHQDYTDCCAALAKVNSLVSEYKDRMRTQENLQKLMEIQRDLVGLDTLVHVDRTFIREGCLQKFSRKGYQQRMFFLFSDLLVYTSRTTTHLLQFKVHGQLPLRGMIVEESDHAKMAVANSFAIYGGNKCILVAASSQEEKDKWIEDLNEAIIQAKNRNDDKLKYSSLKSSTSSSENVEGEGQSGEVNGSPPEKQIQHRANTTMHVCWHRNTSVSMRDHDKAVKNQLSGYLLRKFKNSNGWQKLWVVFTNFCLFFYKTYQDDFPLASLPLLGYAVNTPEEEDGIHKDHVFKLQFKNHVYFFRAESEYTFERWMEVINHATNSSRRVRLFSRMDSNQLS
ncbi:FERM, ARHGEF and pleckstrin domain-containing protein 2-like [Ylistrum balloti]|uniref:FERM, ARHGEF and pleckstrin domain-containing protein 2-like n=1 Tax=Ylistrum balloti TaxID=509963 RepID=UPI002905DE32|nr:FERM, ARHGEF and pleckstrin domain-containing protein 2-like [Ylistrum balloti]